MVAQLYNISNGGSSMRSLLRTLCLALLTAISMTGTTALAADTKLAPLTIYHIEGRRSERLVWLCEEIGRPYQLEYKRGNIVASMAAIREVSPLMPVAPTVRYGDLVMVESGAIIELILAREGGQGLVPPVDSADYAYYLQWMHFAEGSFASRVIADYRVEMLNVQRPNLGYKLVDSEAVLKFADAFLAKHPYFGGSNFSAADIMMLFPTNFAAGMNVVDLADFPNVAAWKQKVESRPAYKKMLEAARPDGLVGSPKPLPKKE